MNGRASRFLRQWAQHAGISTRKAKKEWLNTPRNERASVRKRLSESMGINALDS